MTDNIKPEHYRKGEIDLFESWYRTYPFNEYRAIMQAVAERYMRRDKNDRIEDIGKAIYTLERLKEKEVEHAEKSTRTLKEVLREITKTGIAGKYFDETYFNRDDLLKRLRSDDYKYLARDESGDLFAYTIEPEKKNYIWTIYFDDCEIIENDNFPEIQWTDDEPTRIVDLLATYENGGGSGN